LPAKRTAGYGEALDCAELALEQVSLRPLLPLGPLNDGQNGVDPVPYRLIDDGRVEPRPHIARVLGQILTMAGRGAVGFAVHGSLAVARLRDVPDVDGVSEHPLGEGGGQMTTAVGEAAYMFQSAFP